MTQASLRIQPPLPAPEPSTKTPIIERVNPAAENRQLTTTRRGHSLRDLSFIRGGGGGLVQIGGGSLHFMQPQRRGSPEI